MGVMNRVIVAESELLTCIARVFMRLGVPQDLAVLSARSLVDASLLGVETHGVDALPMYIGHLRSGGLKAEARPVRVSGRRAVEQWDAQHGFGLAAGRIMMAEAIRRATADGIYFATCRNANHLGACGVYAKMAADAGLIGVVSQQTLASLAPWGGLDVRVGASPFAMAAPIKDAFPFYFDASMAALTRSQIKRHRQNGALLPEGTAMDAEGQPTRDPEEAWSGQIMPIGAHKGVGLAMVFEILSSVLSGGRPSTDIPSIVDHPDQSADSGFFLMAIDPTAMGPLDGFTAALKRYVDQVETSSPRNADDPPRYPGRREGSVWQDRTANGVPISPEVWLQAKAILEAP